MADTQNPYAAPQADELRPETFESAIDLTDATQGMRIANFVLDTIFRQIAAVGVVAITVPLHAEELGIGLTLLTIFGYYVFFEALTGRTPAKYITRTRVVDVFGGKPRFTQILGRSAARFIPLEPFSCLGTPCRGWHDSLSKTRVVRI